MRTTHRLLILSFASAAFIHAEQIAITDTGDRVILYDDGRWAYLDKDEEEANEIERNEKAFTRSDSLTFPVKSKRNNSMFFIDPKKWIFKRGDHNENQQEYEFTLKDEDLYGMAVTEGWAMNVDALAKAAVANAKEVAPDARVVKKEYRTVNGTEVIYMETAGTISGIEFTYLGYYHSDESGSTQFLAYTGSKMVDKYRPHIESFLNGFSLQESEGAEVDLPVLDRSTTP